MCSLGAKLAPIGRHSPVLTAFMDMVHLLLPIHCANSTLNLWKALLFLFFLSRILNSQEQNGSKSSCVKYRSHNYLSI